MGKVKKKSFQDCACYFFHRFEPEPCSGCYYFRFDHLHCPFDLFQVSFVQLSLFDNGKF